MRPRTALVAGPVSVKSSLKPPHFTAGGTLAAMTKPSSPSPALDALVTAARGRLARKRPLLIAIDGRSGSGKSTLAEAAAKDLAATIVVADDFYSGGADAEWASVSVEERVDRVIDWRRLRRSALEPLLGGEAARWHPLDFEPVWAGSDGRTKK